MLNSGEKICALRDKKKHFNSRVVRNFFSERSKKLYPPPLQVKWSVPYNFYIENFRELRIIIYQSDFIR